MATFSVNVGENVALRFDVTETAPLYPTAENYRYDLSYNDSSRGFCEVQFFDADRNEYAPLAGTPADLFLLRIIEEDARFSGCKYVYCQVMTETEIIDSPNVIIDVTPTDITPRIGE